MTGDQARELTKSALKGAEVPEVEITLSDRRHGFLRFARNAPTTSGLTRVGEASVTAWKGKRKATVEGSVDLGNPTNVRAELRVLMAQAEELAAISPEDRQYMPLLGPQEYLEVNAFDSETGDLAAKRRARSVADAITEAKQRKVIAAGFFENSANEYAVANSAGLFGYHRSTDATFSVTARTPDDQGSGYTKTSSHRVGSIDFKETVATASKKAIDSHNGRELKPGEYPAILEPQAAADLIGRMMPRILDARLADEGRSVFSAAGGKTRLGERIFDPRVNIYTDPAHAVIPSAPFGSGGLPARKTDLVREGVLKNLLYSRFWAQKQEKTPGPPLPNLIMEGSDTSLGKLIASTERGVLVTRFWYIRSVDPQQALYTGLTRDGLFWIEDGKVRRPLKNFRFNESPYRLLGEIDALGQTQATAGWSGPLSYRMLLPALRVKSFRFSSISDAV